MDKFLNTNVLFTGGAGMFIQYHDIVKPVYLYSIIKMIITNETFGLPINIIKNMSNLSIIEWYIKRRFINPFKCLDYNHHLDDESIDDMLLGYILHDESLYRLAPALNISKIIQVYKQQQMRFPIYVYSETEEPPIKEDCKKVFDGINFLYLYGDLKDAIKKCEQNFTYIFSDIELVKKASDILLGTYSHILLSSDYRYNYTDDYKTLKYDLRELQNSHPYLRIGLTNSVNMRDLAISIANLNKEGGSD